jgi:Flp pilus assembly protein TadB
MSRENWWIAAKIFVGLPVLFYLLLSVLEPQKEIWRKPTRKVLLAFIVAWGAVFGFIAFVLVWNAHR